jgi:hypothetical protein
MPPPVWLLDQILLEALVSAFAWSSFQSLKILYLFYENVVGDFGPACCGWFGDMLGLSVISAVYHNPYDINLCFVNPARFNTLSSCGLNLCLASGIWSIDGWSGGAFKYARLLRIHPCLLHHSWTTPVAFMDF